MDAIARRGSVEPLRARTAAADAARPVPPSSGLYCHGVAHDVTERVRMDLRIAIEHGVVALLERSRTIEEATPLLIEMICRQLQWRCGARWELVPGGESLRCAQTWGAGAPEIGELLEAPRRMAPGVESGGLTWRAWASGDPIWIPDVTAEASFRRAPRALEAGLRGALAFPVVAAGHVVAVLEFFGPQVREPDQQLLDCMRYIGAQIGQFMQGRREQQLSALEHEVTRCLAEPGDPAVTMGRVLEAICRCLQWSCGHYFGLDAAAQVLRFAGAWHEGGEAIAGFVESSRGLTYARAQGLIGTSWEGGEPIFVADITKDGRLHHGSAREAGLRGAFLFPAAAAGSVLGVLAFYSEEVRQPDGRLLAAVAVISSQIGQFLQRQRVQAELRESEARLRSLTALSSDFFWMSDAGHRITADASDGFMQGDGGALARHRAVLEAHRPFRDLEVERLDDEGNERHVSLSGEPVFDSAGAFIGYRGVGKDITESKRERALLALEHGVTRVLAEAADADSALKDVLRAVCQSQGWDCGRYYYADREAGLLRFGGAWGIDCPEVRAYIEGSRSYVSTLDSGFKARAWRTGIPHWGPERSRSGELAKRTLGGARDSIVFPVTAGSNGLGVMSFTSRGVRKPDARMLKALAVIGPQVGQFLQRKQAEDEVRVNAARFRTVVDSLNEGVLIYDRDLRVVGGNRAIERIVGVPLETLIENNGFTSMLPCINADGSPLTPEQRPRNRALREGKPVTGMLLGIARGDSPVQWLSVNSSPMQGPGDEGHFGVVSTFTDITSRKLDEERIGYLASHDGLTGLVNRPRFGETLGHAILDAQRYGRGFAVLFIDLDRFKIINDTFGHDAGDELLKEIATRLTRSVRAGDVVGRLGGDEFVVLVREVSEQAQVEAVARKILAAATHPVSLQGRECTVTASIGICMYPGDAADEQTMMKCADIAMYRAKQEGKNRYKFFSDELKAAGPERITLEADLRQALERNQLFLQYQAMLNLQTGDVTGVEALLRWRHPQRGLISPAEFIPIAEETGDIVAIGDWVLKTACAQSVAWQRSGLPALRVSVNVSPRQFREELVEEVAAALRESGIQPRLLQLEVTESMVVRDVERTASLLASIKALGVRVAIDDFGVGYSSLNHLRKFPIDTLKVDRSFIRDISSDEGDRTITEAIIAMGKSLKLTVVAEGVETLEQEAFLRQHDCDESQGFYFAPPTDPGQFAEFLRGRLDAPRRAGGHGVPALSIHRGRWA